MLLLAVSGNLLLPSAAGTAELVSNFYKIFDCLNSATFYSRPTDQTPNTVKEMCLLLIRIEVKTPATGKDVRCLNDDDIEIIISANLQTHLDISTKLKTELCTKMCSVVAFHFAFPVRHVVSKYLHMRSSRE